MPKLEAFPCACLSPLPGTARPASKTQNKDGRRWRGNSQKKIKIRDRLRAGLPPYPTLTDRYMTEIGAMHTPCALL